MAEGSLVEAEGVKGPLIRAVRGVLRYRRGEGVAPAGLSAQAHIGGTHLRGSVGGCVRVRAEGRAWHLLLAFAAHVQ